MTYTNKMLIVSIVLMAGVWCWATSVGEQSIDNKNKVPLMTSNNEKREEKREGKYRNYLRLPEGECYNCSTYKCTNHTANMGGSDWCIMLFPAALAHCDSDPNCGGYTMTTAQWFRTKYDKNGQLAVHLTRAGDKPMVCPLAEWSSYEKQNSIRNSPVSYGRSTCDDSSQATCEKPQHFDYVFVSNSNAVAIDEPYLCKNHPKSLDNKDLHCILPISDGMTLCNSDNNCQGFMIETGEDWQTKHSKNGMQAVELFGQGVTYTPSQTRRSFKKQQ